MAKKEKQIKTDISKQYIIPLCPIIDPYGTVDVVCNVTAENGVIKAVAAEDAECFEVHRYIDEFFQWQLYTGKIKEYIPEK